MDVLANAERVIENLAEYGEADKDGHALHTAVADVWQVKETLLTGAVPDPVSSLTFVLSLLAAAYARRAGSS